MRSRDEMMNKTEATKVSAKELIMMTKATIATMISAILMMSAPVKADVIADQSRIHVLSDQWSGVDTVVLPILGTRTLQ